jgi:hypothetical protein
MLNCNTTIPTHISSLIHQLQISTDLHDTLLQHAHLIQSDMTLYGIYLALGYDPIRFRFLQPVSLNCVLEKIQAEYETPENAVRSLAGNVTRLCHEIDAGRNREETSAENRGGVVSSCGKESPFINDDSQNSIWSRSTNDVYSPDFLLTESGALSSMHYNLRGLKGLKALSVYLKDMVKGRYFTSYKEITDQVVQTLGLKEECPEIKNIRRRLYDALNVMSAVGYVNISYKEFSNYFIPRSSESIEDLTASIQNKRRILADLVKKVESMKKILSRNSKKRHREVIPFPFILLAIKPSSSSISPKVSSIFKPLLNTTVIKSRSAFEVLGDIDVVSRMNLKHVRCEGVQEEVYRLLKR